MTRHPYDAEPTPARDCDAIHAHQDATQDEAIPWTLADLDRIITDLDNQIEAEEAHPELPVFVDFPMQEMSRA